MLAKLGPSQANARRTLDVSILTLKLSFRFDRSDGHSMRMDSVFFRLLATALVCIGAHRVSAELDSRAAALAFGANSGSGSPIIQSRRLVIDRLQRASALAASDPMRAESILTDIVRHTHDAKLRSHAIGRLIELAEPEWPNDHRRSFLRLIAGPAIESARHHRIPPSVILAQAILESGWGRSALARKHNNIFGIKATGSSSSADYPTLEFGAKGVHIVRATFRVFDSIDASVAHHGELLSTDRRYAAALQHRSDWKAYIGDVAPHYASDPRYARLVTQLIRSYRLDRWDSVASSETETS